MTKTWDVFISHASEDKETVVRPLAEQLRRYGLRVWYDEYALSVGDALRGSIDRGLGNSRYGVVILSQAFFSREWPQRELDGLFALEVNGTKLILPVWHRVTRQEVALFSPMLCDRVAISTANGLDAVVNEIVRVVKQGARPEALRPNRSILNLTRDRPRTRVPHSAHFRVIKGLHDDVLAPESLITKIKRAQDPVSIFLRDRLSANTCVLLDQYTDDLSFSALFSTVEALVDDLNAVIQGPSIYDARRFAHVSLTEKTRALLARNPTGQDLALLNRFLICDAYPRELRKQRYSPLRDLAEITVYFNLMAFGGLVAVVGVLSLFGIRGTIPELYPPGIVWWHQVLAGTASFLLGRAIFRRCERPFDPLNGPRLVPAALLGGSSVGSPRRHIPLPESWRVERLRIVTEGLRQQRLSDREWELRVKCGLFNHHDARIQVFDVHANEYIYEDGFVAAGVIGNRREVITLYQDNSILENSTYELEAQEYFPIELVFHIERERPGAMSYGFGLLVDYYVWQNRRWSRKMRSGSDDLFLFHCGGDSLPLAEASFVTLTAASMTGARNRNGRLRLRLAEAFAMHHGACGTHDL